MAGQASDDEVDLDRTIADLEATVAGQDASEPAFTKDPDAQADDRAPDVQAADGAGVQDAPHETTGYDHLFGATMMRSVEDAAARPPAEEGEASAEAAPVTVVPPAPLAVAPPALAQTGDGLGDHDGLTVMSGDLRALRDTAASSPQPAAPQPAAATTEPPTAEPPAAPVEAGFVLQLPDGAAEPIDGMVVVGRAPSVSKMGGGRVPRLVTVDSVEHDISRNHVQLTIEGGTVVVTDLHSRNGTLIALPGKSPQKLRAGEPTSVIAGTVIDLGSGVTLGVVQA